MVVQKKFKKFKFFNKPSSKFLLALSPYLLILGCGNSRSDVSSQSEVKFGFSSDYDAPRPNYTTPVSKDPNFRSLNTDLSEAYWIGALEMDQADQVIQKILSDNDRVIEYGFPSSKPQYDTSNTLGWNVATTEIQQATLEVFNYLSNVLNVTFSETDIFEGNNIIAISRSDQESTSGYAFLPNSEYFIGSDIQISNAYSFPRIVDTNSTNYDYEVLIHEIGHALGLKHPFEANGENNIILSKFEDNTTNTVMSYEIIESSFTGNFRALDLTVLTSFYGVNPIHNGLDNTYRFDPSVGVFIIDGGGIDKIDASDAFQDIYIDLRPGAHSFSGSKLQYITQPNQLTISNGSEIENVYSGTGNDTIIANNLSNEVRSLSGNDKIFAGEGADLIYPGEGADIIDLSEFLQSQDKVFLSDRAGDEGSDIIYGFMQGVPGDIIDLSYLNINTLTALPLVDAKSVPNGIINDCVVRVFGSKFDNYLLTATDFAEDGILGNLDFFANGVALVITAASQDTGEDQRLFEVKKDQENEFCSVEHLVTFIGNYLDIDMWTVSNFNAGIETVLI